MFKHDELVGRALLVLEAALNDTDKAPVPRSLALRFTLAYVYSVAGGERGMFDSFWRYVTDDRPCEDGHQAIDALGRSANANAALNGIYRAVGVTRTNDMMFKGPRERATTEDATSRRSPPSGNGPVNARP